MFELTNGNIFAANVEALVNTVNCVGIAGRGIALAFRQAFPENYKTYVKACEQNKVQPGQMLMFETGHLSNPKYIVNFPTKRHWKGKSRIEDIKSGLEALVREVQTRKITSIAIPPLGCGLGGLDWNEVRPLIENAFSALPDVHALIFEPDTESSVRQNPSTDPPKMTPGRAALVGLMNHYLNGLLDPFVSLLEVHKLMYFLQMAGEPLRLQYKKAFYGPFAENLSHVLKAIDGHFLYGYGDGGDHPDKHLELVPGALPDALAFLKEHLNTQARFDRVSDLVEGFESSFGLELLSTVHWVATNENVQTSEQMVARVHGWNDHKKQFSSRQILLAWLVLQEKNWLPA